MPPRSTRPKPASTGRRPCAGGARPYPRAVAVSRRLVRNRRAQAAIKMLRSTRGEGSGAPGTVLDDRLTIACGDGAVRIVELQRAGGRPMKAEEFLRGTPVAPGRVCRERHSRNRPAGAAGRRRRGAGGAAGGVWRVAGGRHGRATARRRRPRAGAGGGARRSALSGYRRRSRGSLSNAARPRDPPVAGLAPLGVVPPMAAARHRRRAGPRGPGAAQGDAGETLVFVLGDPAYYRRFGFAAAPDFVSRYAGPYFQVLRLTRRRAELRRRCRTRGLSTISADDDAALQAHHRIRRRAVRRLAGAGQRRRRCRAR